MGKYTSEEIKKIYNESHLLYIYVGEKYRLVFYSNNQQDSKLEIDINLVDDSYLILIDEEYFISTLKDNQNALAELEKIVSYNRGIAGYFYYGLGYLFFLWMFYFYPSAMTGYILYNLPFYMQITGMIIIYGIVFLLPLWLTFKVRESRISTVYKSKLMLHYLKDKEYRKKKNELTEINKNGTKWWNKQFLITKISPFHNLGKKVIALYSLFLIFYISLFTFFYLNVDVPLSYLPTLYNEMTTIDYSNTDIIKTKYEFTEKKGPISLTDTYQPCGDYFCDRYDDIIYDNNFNPLDLNQYLETGESFSQILTVNEGIVVFNYCTDDTNERSYKVVDLETNLIMYDINSTFLNLQVDFYIFLDAAVHNSEIYLSGTVHEGDNKSGYLVKIDNDNNITTYKSTNGTIVSTVTYYNDFLYITELLKQNPDNMIIKILNSGLEIIDEKIIDNLRTMHTVVIDNKIIIIIRASEEGMTNYYQVTPTLELEKSYTQILDTLIIQNDKDSLYSGITLKSYREFNSDFEIINKGLQCFECTDEEYFKQYSFIKDGDKLYALSDEDTLLFTQTPNYHYSLSRSPLTIIGFILYLLMFIAPITIWLMVISRRNKDTLITKEYLKTFLNDKIT